MEKIKKENKVLKIQNCNDCLFISLTEEEQENTSEKHICLKYDRRVFHRSKTLEHLKHNFLYPCKECNGKDFKPNLSYMPLCRLIPAYRGRDNERRGGNADK